MCAIKIDKDIEQDSIHIKELDLKKNNIKSEKIILHFGSLQKELKIKVDNQLQASNIKVPHMVTEEIYIPPVLYESYFRDNHLYLGPVIGYLTAYNCRFQSHMKLYFTKYSIIKGLIYIFQEKGINRNNQTIKGYYYNDETKSFVEGVFPYPGAVYVRKHISRGVFEDFNKHIGNKIFNYPFNVDKLTLWKILSRVPELMHHLPETEVYTNIKNLLDIMEINDEVYLKPFNKSRGRGIFHLKKFKNWYILKDEFSHSIPLKTKANLEKALKKKLCKDTKYLIQKAIPLQYGRNKADFRIYIQKNRSKTWVFSGMETKIAKAGSIISNSRNRAKIIPGEIALKEIFSLNDDKVDALMTEAAELCIKALKIIENHNYHIGDTAIDLIIDKNLKIWILEIQLNYAALKKANRTEDEKQVLPKILSTPFEYAKALAEF
ncbi:YheC/D like ATP-grasp [Natronincola peptidivorans]|uniref:YheC/D like ATP-grasp n=1 Tax=Natronincola peptidivorans TaxID=426128 RepID=A0A1H9YTX0_9FIRM|nr:YheC/YheD family protein [Natronincola peptidivorans]SES72574.1 YheC/D like ATP-grasp [Natronincola peptidivorans]